MDELQLWNLWSSNRIGSGLINIGIVLAIWLSIRIAAATRASDEANLLTKLISTAFGLTILSFAWEQYTIVANLWISTANGLSNLKEAGTEITSTADGFIAYVGTTDPATMPIPIGIAFIVISGLIILGNIWLPKQ